MEEVIHLLETKLSSTPLSASALVQPNIPALCEQLIILVLNRQIKESMSVQLTYEQVKRLSSQDVKKHCKRYEMYVDVRQQH